MAVEASVVVNESGGVIFDRARLGARDDPGWFDANWWRAQGPVSTPSGGRGSAWFVTTPAGPAVLRHYRRGGFVARFNRDRYWFTTAETTRPFLEFALLDAAKAQGLSAPAPLAARYVREGAWYRADILVAAIEGSMTLAQALATRAVTIAWAVIGACIARFHAAGFAHADLNAHNILLRGNDAWLIDFDRGERREPAVAWQRANLERLHRSLMKLGAMTHLPDFATRAWPALEAAYERTMREIASVSA